MLPGIRILLLLGLVALRGLDCLPIDDLEDNETYHDPVSPSNPEKEPAATTVVHAVEDIIPEDSKVPEKPTEESHTIKVTKPTFSWSHGFAQGIPTLVDIKMTVPNIFKKKPDKVDRVDVAVGSAESSESVEGGHHVSVDVDKTHQPHKPLNLKIHIPNIFQFHLGDMPTGERRLGILAPFFKLDLTREAKELAGFRTNP